MRTACNFYMGNRGHFQFLDTNPPSDPYRVKLESDICDWTDQTLIVARNEDEAEKIEARFQRHEIDPQEIFLEGYDEPVIVLRD